MSGLLNKYLLHYLVLADSQQQNLIRLTVIDLNPIELIFFPFMVDLDKCNGSFNVVDDLYMEIYVPIEREVVNVKVFDMIARIYEAKNW